jgi:tRNA A-37 threonylcarbamoyl transferase component Bud32
MAAKSPPERQVATELAPGLVLKSRYEIQKELGRGGIGVVYLARDTTFNRPVVVKLLLAESARNEWLEHKFQHEREALGRLQHHNIVGVIDADETPTGQPFIVMEYVEGVTLRSQITAGGMDLLRVARLVRQLGRALNAAHEEGVVHRDLKPENVMLASVDEEELVKVIDFGIAKVQNPRFAPGTEISRLLAGTYPYMSPQQLDSETATASCDIFALGVMAYEMVTGQRPFAAENPVQLYLMQREGVRALPKQLRRELPDAAQTVMLRALAFERAARYTQARDFGNALSDALAAAYRAPASDVPTAVDTMNWTFTSSPTSSGVWRVALLYKRGAEPDGHVLQLLEDGLRAAGHSVFIDRHLSVGVEWAQEIARQIGESDAVVPLLSETSCGSEMLEYEVLMAHEAAQTQGGKPRLLPVRVNFEGPLPDVLDGILSPLQYALWRGPDDDESLVTDILAGMERPSEVRTKVVHHLEPPGGAVPLTSELYVVRPTDEQFLEAIRQRDSIVLVKGARQMGKTSLLARGLQKARESGAKVAITDFQKLNNSDLASVTTLFQALGELMADQLDLDVYPSDVWRERSAPSVNFERYLRREVLKNLDAPLVWGMDEVDRLFTCTFGSEVFGLFRSWHNERAVNPDGPWGQLTLAIAYATEAHLFITDLNQSPFNVGTRLELHDFTPEQLDDLNRRHGSPLRGQAEVTHFHHLTNGHPYLVRRGLHDMATQGLRLAEFENLADRNDGPYGDHLRRILVLLARDPELCDIVRAILQGQPAPTMESFYRLRSAGLMTGDTPRDARPRCKLYGEYLKKHLL